jgi:hypothetical protein
MVAAIIRSADLGFPRRWLEEVGAPPQRCLREGDDAQSVAGSGQHQEQAFTRICPGTSIHNLHITSATYKTFTAGQARHHPSIGPESEARETQPAFISKAATAPRGVSTRSEGCSCLHHAGKSHHQWPPKMK